LTPKIVTILQPTKPPTTAKITMNKNQRKMREEDLTAEEFLECFLEENPEILSEVTE